MSLDRTSLPLHPCTDVVCSSRSSRDGISGRAEGSDYPIYEIKGRNAIPAAGVADDREDGTAQD